MPDPTPAMDTRCWPCKEGDHAHCLIQCCAMPGEAPHIVCPCDCRKKAAPARAAIDHSIDFQFGTLPDGKAVTARCLRCFEVGHVFLETPDGYKQAEAQFRSQFPQCRPIGVPTPSEECPCLSDDHERCTACRPDETGGFCHLAPDGPDEGMPAPAPAPACHHSPDGTKFDADGNEFCIWCMYKENRALKAEVERLTEAVRWALGERVPGPAFEPPVVIHGKYWWRKELRRRAALKGDGRGGNHGPVAAARLDEPPPQSPPARCVVCRCDPVVEGTCLCKGHAHSPKKEGGA